MKYFRDFSADTSLFDNKSILITGGTGSFGSAMVKTLLKETKAQRIVIYSRDELKQYQLQNQIAEIKDSLSRTRFFIGDVRDRNRLEMALFNIDFIIHAAAMKQITTAEYNPFECLHTNVIGAENIIQASLRMGIKKVIALSTDKAASPINLYGASKLASDKLFTAANNLGRARNCRFSVVRYGNVIGSRGSVIELYKKLIAEKADHLPITDPRMTRFWISLSQGISFVMSGLKIMQGGEIFIPKIPSMRITDLAKAMAPSLPHKIIGMRAGEKLHEVMIPLDDALNTVELDDHYVILPSISPHGAESHFDDLKKKSKPCAENFQYSSDKNKEWLQAEDLEHWLAL